MRPNNLTSLQVDLDEATRYGCDVALGLAYVRFRRNLKPHWRPSRQKLTEDIGISQRAAQRATDIIQGKSVKPKQKRGHKNGFKSNGIEKTKSVSNQTDSKQQNGLILNGKTVSNQTGGFNIYKDIETIDTDIYLGRFKSNGFDDCHVDFENEPDQDRICLIRKADEPDHFICRHESGYEKPIYKDHVRSYVKTWGSIKPIEEIYQ